MYGERERQLSSRKPTRRILQTPFVRRVYAPRTNFTKIAPGGLHYTARYISVPRNTYSGKISIFSLLSTYVIYLEYTPPVHVTKNRHGDGRRIILTQKVVTLLLY